MVFMRCTGAFTLQKNFGPDPPKKKYGSRTFVKKYWSFRRAIGAYGPAKLQYFFTKVLGPYFFFGGSGPKFFCSVNAPFKINKCNNYIAV